MFQKTAISVVDANNMTFADAQQSDFPNMGDFS